MHIKLKFRDSICAAAKSKFCSKNTMLDFLLGTEGNVSVALDCLSISITQKVTML